MKAAKLLAATLVTAAASSGLAALAVDYPTKAFDLTYAMTTPTGASQMRMASDGKGKVLTQQTVANMKITSVADYPGKVMYSIMDAQKMVYKMKMPAQQGNIMTDEAAKKLQAKSLGNKVIDGHPCKGWLYSSTNNTSTETWLATDLEAAVKSITKTPQGTTTMTLKSVSMKTPDASVFAIPTGYKVVQSPQ
ncbi:MAG: DUF4412 domain-containing protein [Candidatus Obscuribacterales bacterium]